MKNNILFKSFFYVLILSAIINAAEKPSWHYVDTDIQKKLLNGKLDLCDLANELSTKAPDNAKDALYKLNIMLRAGLDDEAVKTVERLKVFSDEINDHLPKSIYYTCCDRYKAWDVAQAIVENFTEKHYELTLYNRLIEHFERSGWTFEKIDRWLVEQDKKARNKRLAESIAPKDAVVIHINHDINQQRKHFWPRQRIEFLTLRGKESILAEQLEQKIRNNPNDTDSVIYYLELIRALTPEKRKRYDTLWISEIYQSQSATEARTVAELFRQIKHWSGAKVFYLRALKIQLTDKEAKYLASRVQRVMSLETYKIRFNIGLLENIADCLIKLDEPEKAQEFMGRANNLRQKHNIDANLYLAGRVHARSGARTIEKRLKEEEQLSSDDPKYWLKRADYYAGSKDFKQMEDAYLKALELSKPAPPPKFKAPHPPRQSALGKYTRLLKKQGREAEAYALLLKEIKTAPPDTASSQLAARKLAYDFPNLIDPNEKIIWDWLDSQPVWDNAEERLLWSTLEKSHNPPMVRGMGGPGGSTLYTKTPSKELQANLKRAEKMAFGKDASRAKTVGEIMNRMGYTKRAIPLLIYAIEHANNKEVKESAAFTLFRSYLDCNDWKNAEKMFTPASGRLTSKETPKWFGRIAVVAARSGDKKDAMRLWKKVANCDLRNYNLIRNLSSQNMTDELIEYYDKIAKKLPRSVAPKKVREILNENIDE